MDWTVLPCAQPGHVRVRCGAVRCGGCVSVAGVSTQASTMAAAEKEQGSRSRISDSS